MELQWTPTVRIFMKFEIRIYFRKSVEFFFLVLVGPQVAKKPPCILSTQMFTVVFMKTCCPPPIQNHINPLHHPQSHTSKYLNIILPSTAVSSKLSLSLRHSYQNPVCISLPSHTSHIPCTSHFSWCNPNHWSVQITKHHIMQFLLHTAKQRLPLLITQFVDDGRNTSVFFVEEGPSLYLLRS